MRRTVSAFIVLIVFIGLVLSGCTSPAKEEELPITIGVLTMGESRNAKFEGLRQGLSELGLVEPQINFSLFNAYDNEEELEAGAQGLIRQKPDVLVAAGVIEAEALARNLKGKPVISVVMIGVTFPSSLQAVFSEQGIPTTGVDNGHIELTGKRMELLRLIFPNRDRFLLVYDPRIKASTLALQQAQEVAKSNHYNIEPIPIAGDYDLTKLTKRSFSSKEAMLILPSYYLESRFREIRNLSLAGRIPVMGLYDTEAEAGYTASYGISYFDQGSQAARLVVRMVKEKRSIPFEMPDSVYLKLNLKAVEQIGESVSPVGLSFANKIYTVKE